MKKQTVISTLALTTLLIGASSVYAQTSVEGSASAEVNSGGLGKGINSMVRNILIDTDSAPSPYAAPPAAEATLMMQMSAPADASARLAPQAAPMAFKASNADVTIMAMTDEELAAYVHTLLTEDSNIQSIDTSDTHVRITYAVPATVLRFVHVIMRVTVSANADGTTHVVYPWYSFAMKSSAVEMRARVVSDVQPLITSESFTPDQQRILIDAIHMTLASELGASTRGDQ